MNWRRRLSTDAAMEKRLRDDDGFGNNINVSAFSVFSKSGVT